MKRVSLLLFCLMAFFPAAASHIVGGEFELLYLSPNRYRINLILYFDQLNGDAGAKDPNVTAMIFRMSDNVPMMSVFLELMSETPVSYTQPECSKGEIVTTRILYSTVVTLSNSFNDPQGYYISWERCCRNYSINNIYSEDPLSGSRYAGQTFYLQFPPVVMDGLPLINSSPRLFPPLSDYGCPNRSYYVDFAGSDNDGDSLVYSIVTPLNTRSANALPPGGLPRPRPYPEVLYRSPYGPSNILGGNPDLSITQDGFLTVTPSKQGLFVFAVKCEEFRNGKKLGEVRRDFQMFVVDKCPVAEPPLIKGKQTGDPDFIYKDNMTLFIPSGDNVDRCIQVQISDPDASKADENFQERVKIKAIPLNFKKKDMPDILPAVTSATLTQGGTVTFDICFEECPPTIGPFRVGIVAYDDACSLPLSDTLRITVHQDLPNNNKPLFNLTHVTETVEEGDTLSWDIIGTDADQNLLNVGVIVDGFLFPNVGMSYTQVASDSGFYRSRLEWITRCDIFDFRKKSNFNITMLLEDEDGCKISDPDTLIFNLAVDLPENNPPVISTKRLSAHEQQSRIITRKVFDKIDFDVTGEDPDHDMLDLFVNGIVFQPASYGVEFSPVTGLDSIGSRFFWDISCKQDLSLKNEFDFEFVLIDDNNKCRVVNADTLWLKMKLEPPDNSKPDLEITNTNPELLFVNNVQSLKVGQKISLALVGKDNDHLPKADLISIEMIEAAGNVEPGGYEFAPAQGEGTAETTFVWDTDCSIFHSQVYENTYTFRFRCQDNRCLNPKADTVDVNFIIRDIDPEEDEFIPPNFISPNGDERNDFFAMLRFHPETGELQNILPKDNCVGRFVGISVYNRWGTEVFQSNNRDFRWYPVREAPGVYFYTLKYSNRDYKGSITLRD